MSEDDARQRLIEALIPDLIPDWARGESYAEAGYRMDAEELVCNFAHDLAEKIRDRDELLNGPCQSNECDDGPCYCEDFNV